MCAYLKLHHNSRLVLNPSYPEILEEDIEKRDWSNLYGHVKEAISKDTPKPVDADFTGDWILRRSRTRFIIML